MKRWTNAIWSDGSGGNIVPPPPISLQEPSRFRVFLEDASEVNKQPQPPSSERVSPEVARHQPVHDRATFAFDSRRLHQTSLALRASFVQATPSAWPFQRAHRSREVCLAEAPKERRRTFPHSSSHHLISTMVCSAQRLLPARTLSSRAVSGYVHKTSTAQFFAISSHICSS